MDNKEGQFKFETVREYLVVSFMVIWLWQIYQVFHIYRVAPTMKDTLSMLGASLPKITEFYLSFYRWFVILPIITLILTIDFMRRKKIPKIYSLTIFGCVGMITLIMQTFTQNAFFRPLFDLIEKIGQ